MKKGTVAISVSLPDISTCDSIFLYAHGARRRSIVNPRKWECKDSLHIPVKAIDAHPEDCEALEETFRKRGSGMHWYFWSLHDYGRRPPKPET